MVFCFHFDDLFSELTDLVGLMYVTALKLLSAFIQLGACIFAARYSTGTYIFC